LTGTPALRIRAALLAAVALLAVGGCAKPGEASGTLTSGDDGEPIGGVGVLALGDSRDADCARRETTADEDGDAAADAYV
jgi:hypothetical protein